MPQVESLKSIAAQALAHFPFYRANPRDLRDGLTLRGSLPPFRFSPPGATILVCVANTGARAVAGEVKAAAEEASAGRGTVSIAEADMALVVGGFASNTTLLLYLNEGTFTDAGGDLTATVMRAMELQVPIAMIYEQDETKGGCAFGQYFVQTPQVLQRPPYKLFDRVAVPLFSCRTYRKVSLRLVLRDMGAEPCNAGLLERQWQLLRHRDMAFALPRLRFRRSGRRGDRRGGDGGADASLPIVVGAASVARRFQENARAEISHRGPARSSPSGPTAGRSSASGGYGSNSVAISV